MISIDEKIVISEKDSKADTFENSELYTSRTATNNVNDDINTEYMKKKVEALLGVLSEREKKIVKKFYGIDCIPESYDTIALDMNIGGERCRQICTDAIKKMKRYKRELKNNF